MCSAPFSEHDVKGCPLFEVGRSKKKKYHHETSVLYQFVFKIYRNKNEAQTVKLTFKRRFLQSMAMSVLFIVLSHIVIGLKSKKKKKLTSTQSNQTPVGARRLMKAILLRHTLLKNTGQAGFMMKCSRRILNS